MKIVELTGLSYPAVRATIDLFETGVWTVMALFALRRDKLRSEP